MEKNTRSFFHNLINTSHFSKDTMVKFGCIQIFDYLVPKKMDSEVSFLFEELRSHVDKSVDNEDFIYSVFYLCRKDINVLRQEFSVWNSQNQIFDHYFDKEIILEMLRSKEYYNPISGEHLNESEFEEQIVTFFSPTNYFLEKKNG